MSDENKKNAPHPENPECTAFCPKCGTDLYLLDHECVCKNKNCSFRCVACAEEDDI